MKRLTIPGTFDCEKLGNIIRKGDFPKLECLNIFNSLYMVTAPKQARIDAIRDYHPNETAEIFNLLPRLWRLRVPTYKGN
jgi:hypothetical protein